jgi:FtsZ-interacting cell division protein YlmF
MRYKRVLRREVQLWGCMQRAFKKLEFDDDMIESLGKDYGPAHWEREKEEEDAEEAEKEEEEETEEFAAAAARQKQQPPRQQGQRQRQRQRQQLEEQALALVLTASAASSSSAPARPGEGADRAKGDGVQEEEVVEEAVSPVTAVGAAGAM